MTVPGGAEAAALVAVLLLMLRIGAAFVVLPIFSAFSLPLMARIGLAGAVALLVHAGPGYAGTDHLGVDPLSLAGLVVAVQEIALGLAAGTLVRLAFAGALVAGDYIANNMGLGFASMVDPQGGVQSPVMGQMLQIFASLIFLALDGHLILIGAFAESYRLLPPGGDWPLSGIFWSVVDFGGVMFSAGALIALPVAATLFGINIVIGFMTRSAPQLNIFAIGLPISLLAGFVVLALFFPMMAAGISALVERGIFAAEGVLGGHG